MAEAITLTQLLKTLESGDDERRLSLNEVMTVVGERGYGPLILIVALIAALPTGAVPGIPSLCGVSIALICAQLALGKRHPWLPRRLRDLSIERGRYVQIAERITPWTRRLDRLVRPRLQGLTHGLAARLIGVACIGLGLCMIPLEIIPFASAAPAGGIAMMGLGLTGRDGVWVVLGLVPAGLAVWLVLSLIG